MFLPMLADHASVAVQAAIRLWRRRATATKAGRGPQLVGIHTGVAYVGTVGMGHERDFTAWTGNVTARWPRSRAERCSSARRLPAAGLDLGETETPP